jgi:hypothetical protein
MLGAPGLPAVEPGLETGAPGRAGSKLAAIRGVVLKQFYHGFPLKSFTEHQNDGQIVFHCIICISAPVALAPLRHSQNRGNL